jgi:hypothetical protein
MRSRAIPSGWSLPSFQLSGLAGSLVAPGCKDGASLPDQQLKAANGQTCFLGK